MTIFPVKLIITIRKVSDFMLLEIVRNDIINIIMDAVTNWLYKLNQEYKTK